MKIKAEIFKKGTEIEIEGTNKGITCEETVREREELEEIIKYHWGFEVDEYELEIVKVLGMFKADDDPTGIIIYIEMNVDTFEVALSNGEDTGEQPSKSEQEAIELAATWQNWNTFKWEV